VAVTMRASAFLAFCVGLTGASTRCGALKLFAANNLGAPNQSVDNVRVSVHWPPHPLIYLGKLLPRNSSGILPQFRGSSIFCLRRKEKIDLWIYERVATLPSREMPKLTTIKMTKLFS
jgi:hypothetical protein